MDAGQHTLASTRAYLVARGRELLAEATKNNVIPFSGISDYFGERNIIEADGMCRVAESDVDGCPRIDDDAVDLIFFAVSSLPMLLDMIDDNAPAMRKVYERNDGEYGPKAT